jgi:malate dehydrogenase (oxaloacetate-decarboxylating)(NADP+)
MSGNHRDISRFGGCDRPRGATLLNSPLLNKGTAFTQAERAALGLQGLVPPRIFSMDEQLNRVRGNLARKSNDLERYIFLTTLQNRNEVLFYKLVTSDLEAMMPLIYTPTVGEACLEYGAIFRRPRGLFVSLNDRGNVLSVLHNWPRQDARLIVVTDGGRILGLGDLGALGMGICVGKLSLYTACAGVHPCYCLPVSLDVGTDNERLLDDPLYIGLRQKRLRGSDYDDFIDEFVAAARQAFQGAVIQFEDFGNQDAFRILARHRRTGPCFNDDIQGTASVALAGLLSALRVTGGRLADQRLLFYGAGEAGTGIGELFVAAAQEEGLTEKEARGRCWFLDSQGLVVASRTRLADHKRPFAHEHEPLGDLHSAVQQLRPTALIGVSGVGGAFTEPVVAELTRLNQRPIVFALSNPTSQAECTAEQAYAWSEGRALFASGSPFAPVTWNGRRFVPGQGNNVYVFPGIGLATLVFDIDRITDGMFLAASRIIAARVREDELSEGRLYPCLSRIREVSLEIAAAVGEIAYDAGLTQLPRPTSMVDYVRDRMFVPEYVELA